MKRVIFILVILFLLVSCKKIRVRPCPDCFFLYFENPQPENDAELDHFPSRFRGTYSNNDSTFLRIEKDRIISKYFGKYRIHKLEFDSIKHNYVIVGNQAKEKETGREVYLHKKGDSIEIMETFIDTIFRLSYYQKLKRIGGQLILSTKDSIFWTTEFYSLKNESLKRKEIYMQNNLRKLDSITAVKAEKLDSMSYLIKPSRSEFRKILKIKKLGYDQEYRRISN